jgi:ElaB/YqjD/DUF883 family membrane-anchored ribosome-binding protein
MKKLFVIAVLFCGGCIPATQQEVLNLTNTVNQIVPLVREAVSTSSKETRDKVEIVLGQVEELNEVAATAETPIEAVKAVVAATSPFNPYAVPILAGIGILEALGIFIEKKKNTGFEKGLSRVKGEAEPELAKKIHDTMKIYTG